MREKDSPQVMIILYPPLSTSTTALPLSPYHDKNDGSLLQCGFYFFLWLSRRLWIVRWYFSTSHKSRHLQPFAVVLVARIRFLNNIFVQRVQRLGIIYRNLRIRQLSDLISSNHWHDVLSTQHVVITILELVRLERNEEVFLLSIMGCFEGFW